MLKPQTILFLSGWVRHPFASRIVDHVLIAHFVNYGDDLADYFEHILNDNDYSPDERVNALQAIQFLLGKSLHFEKQSRSESKRRSLRARILSGEFGQFPQVQTQD